MHNAKVKPNGGNNAGPGDLEMGLTIVGSTRIRVLLDLDWNSLVCLRVAPNELPQYLGVVTGAETETPVLRLTTDQAWRFPTPELRESMRQSALGLYRAWRATTASAGASSKSD